MSFYLDVENRRRILAKKSKEDKFKKPKASFLEPKYISIFGKPLWFIYRSPDKLEKMAKWKLLSSERYAKYNSDSKHHVLTVFLFHIVLDVYLENPVFLSLV